MTTASGIVPRWEWRCFGASFDDLEQRLHDRLGETRFSREVYVVSRHSDANVKIRYGQLDVKTRLDEVDGIELWTPRLKAAFPIDAPTFAAVCGLWEVDPQAAPGGPLDEAAFLALAATRPELRTAVVVKQRRGARVDECAVEVARLEIDGRPVQTAAVEHADRARVRAVVDALGLRARANENYVAAVKRMLLPRLAGDASARLGGRTS